MERYVKTFALLLSTIAWLLLPWISTSGMLHAKSLGERVIGYSMWALLGIGGMVMLAKDFRTNSRTDPKPEREPKP